ncbi:probable dolichyl pyrophosphate Glc1Man9GlcNAc2 alpha-1,3-glucosyltransferase isoform X2 [Gigantopelta aegis]|nr:probable dolichyl pyrophosphate Glc1Man9GlcNAc2 alpha-1,3-glucosyltransferase isoform X2 [Gigantopelta aegis]
MLVISNLNYSSDATILFQWLSVIVSDFVFIYATYRFCTQCVKLKKKDEDGDIFGSHALILAVLLIGNFGLLIVDHIHFQYNGFLMGVMLLSIVRIYEGRLVSGAFWFAILLNLKHIYLYIAPAYFVYLLRCHCFNNSPDGRIQWKSFSIKKFTQLAFVVLFVFGVSFGPFIYLGQLPQVLSRLFPFKRGLCHAYWAPNIWALYNVADKAATVAGVRMKLLNSTSTASMTGGLVQVFNHTVLPSISPQVTVVFTAAAMLPSLIHLWFNTKGPQSLVRCIVLCGLASFIFGWHVHEKAILLTIIPFTLLIAGKKRDAQLFLILSTVGHYSLFPLIFTQFENPIKLLLMIVFSIYAFSSLGNIHGITWRPLKLPLLSTLETLYVAGIVILECYNSAVHYALGLNRKVPFLPLLLTSVYCSVGILYCWVRFYWITLKDKIKKHKTT